MMGMDVHDMENLDQINVGFDEEVRPNLEQFEMCIRDRVEEACEKRRNYTFRKQQLTM